MYIYLNGLCITNVSNTEAFPNVIKFTFGSTSRANSMMDELRVVNFAVAKGGTSYTPTAVPFDSNLVLVLPDSSFPIADEYWDFNSTGNRFSEYDFTSGLAHPKEWYSSSGVSVNYYPGFTSIAGTTNVDVSTLSMAVYGTYDGTNARYVPSNGYISYLGTAYKTNAFVGSWTTNPVFDTTHTFSVLSKDGIQYTHTFNVAKKETGAYYENAARSWADYTEYDWGYLFSYCYVWGKMPTTYYTHYSIGILPKNGKTLDFVYAELLGGTQANTGHEFVSCVYPEAEVKPNTAAIQSDIPVNGYTVGGVRPTFPAKGDIWMPVSGRRISGAYIYTGSMWKEVGCRYYTGTRWIPIYAFDIVTLEDCFDVADASDVTPPITTESGFWNWWKSQWLDFRKWLENVLGSGGGGSGPGGGAGSDDTRSFWDKIADAITGGLATLIEGLFTVITTALTTLLGLVTDLLSFVFNFFTDTVLGGIGKFFSSFSDGSLFEFLEPNEDGTGHLLPNGIATAFAFFSGVVMLLPLELRSVLFFGVAALFLFSVLKFIK